MLMASQLLKVYREFLNLEEGFILILKIYKEILTDFGIYILSTSKGVLSDSEARVESVGGEILCKIF